LAGYLDIICRGTILYFFVSYVSYERRVEVVLECDLVCENGSPAPFMTFLYGSYDESYSANWRSSTLDGQLCSYYADCSWCGNKSLKLLYRLFTLCEPPRIRRLKRSLVPLESLLLW